MQPARQPHAGRVHPVADFVGNQQNFRRAAVRQPVDLRGQRRQIRDGLHQHRVIVPSIAQIHPPEPLPICQIFDGFPLQQCNGLRQRTGLRVGAPIQKRAVVNFVHPGFFAVI